MYSDYNLDCNALAGTALNFLLLPFNVPPGTEIPRSSKSQPVSLTLFTVSLPGLASTSFCLAQTFLATRQVTCHICN